MENVVSLETAKKFLQRDLEIDRAEDDVTARLLGLGSDLPCQASVIAKEAGVFCGEKICFALQALYQTQLTVKVLAKDGSLVQKGDSLVVLQGPTALCLSVERSLLNFLTHLSGIATLTKRFVEAVRPLPVKILATRKTLPGLRDFQLMAVEAGSGTVHRRSLSDGILVKENHIQMASEEALLVNAESLRSPLHRIEVEVQNLVQLGHVLEHTPDVIMLDNLSLEDMKLGISLIRKQGGGRIRIEASGGVNLETVRSIAELGVDYISVGMLTHSAPALNLSLEFGEFGK